MPPLGLPQLSVDPVLFLPLWLGTLRDYSGYGNHGTNTGGHWAARGGADGWFGPAATDVIRVPDSPSIRCIDLTVFWWGNVVNFGDTSPGIISKRDGGGYQFSIFGDAILGGRIGLHDGVNSRTRAVDPSGAESLCVSLVSGEIANVYIDSVLDGPMNGISTITDNDADIYIGNLYTNGNQWNNQMSGVVLYNAVLTPTEIAALHAYSQSRITPRRQWPGSGLRYPDRETNRVTPTPAGAWTANGTNVVSDISDGIKVEYVATANPAVTQVALVNGTQYEIRGEVISDGVHVFNVTDNGATTFGTMMTSTAWQDFLFIGRASASSLILQGMAITTDFSVRNLKVWTRPPGYTHRSGDPTYLDNFQTARVSLVTEASGKFSNTGMDIITGQFELREDGVGRYAYCVSAGKLRRRVLGADGFDTALFIEEGGATITKDATGFDLDFGTGDIIRAVQLTAP